jgi:hypothetical protein
LFGINRTIGRVSAMRGGLGCSEKLELIEYGEGQQTSEDAQVDVEETVGLVCERAAGLSCQAAQAKSARLFAAAAREAEREDVDE